MPEQQKVTRLLLRCLYVALALGALWLFFTWGLGIVLPFFIALLMARLLEPVVLLLQGVKIPRWLGGIVCVVLSYGGLLGCLYLILSRLLYEIGRLLERLPDWIAGAGTFMDELTRQIRALIVAAPPDIQNFLGNTLDKLGQEGITIPQSLYASLGAFVTGLAGSLPSVLLFITACIFSTYFISSDYPRVAAFLVRQIPRRFRDKVLRTKNHLTSTMGKWLRAQGLLMLLTFGEVCVGLILLGVETPLLIAFVIALVDALPILGSGTALIPWGLITLLSGQSERGIGLLILYAVVALMRGFMEPKLIGKQIGLPPLITLFSMYAGFRLLGIWGMILFPILAITVKQMHEWGYIRLWKTREREEAEKRAEYKT